MINYNNKKFKLISVEGNSELEETFVFHYMQNENIITSIYSGENILYGHLLGKVDNQGVINSKYHQIDINNNIMAGKCIASPMEKNGKLYLNEKWQWTAGKKGKGRSILEEVLQSENNIDKRGQLVEDPFSYKITKNQKLIVYRNNKEIKIIGTKLLNKFLVTVKRGDEQQIQLALAKLTGHYKHGNEGQNKV